MAAHAGVSVATVSYVVNGQRGRVSEATRERVAAAVEALEFRPSASAQRLRGKAAGSLGMVVRHLQDPSTVVLVRGAETEAAAHGSTLVLCDLDRVMERADLYARRLADGRVDGVFLAFAYPPLREVARFLTDRGVRCVAFAPESPLPGVPCVTVDSDAGVGRLLDHLVSLGHRRIAFVAHAAMGLYPERRLAAYRREAGVRGVATPPALVLNLEVAADPAVADYDLQAGREAVRRLAALAPGERPTAVMAASDVLALGVLQAAWAAGWRVPEEVSVTGFDDMPFAASAIPPLTTARIPGFEIGRAAAGMLAALLAGEHPQGAVFTPELVARRSTAPPPG